MILYLFRKQRNTGDVLNTEEKSKISRELILKAALAEFTEHGFEGASIRRICKASGVSNGRLFHHFKDKSALYLGCAESVFKIYAEHIVTFELDITKNLEENSLRLYTHWQNFWRIHPETDAITIQMRLNPPPALRSDITAIRRRYFVSPLKQVLHDMFSFYFPNDPKRQSFLTGVWMTVLDYTFVGIGIPKIICFRARTKITGTTPATASRIPRLRPFRRPAAVLQHRCSPSLQLRLLQAVQSS